MKKTISTLLVLALIICNISITYAQTDYAQSFAKEDIEYLISLDVINDSDNVYPERNITRAEFTKIINRAFSFSEKADENFPDISYDKWYYDEFLIAKKQGYITGNELGCADAEKNLSRAEAVVILSRIIDMKDSDESKVFADQNEIPEWALQSISKLVSAEIISGYPDGSFKPYNSLTRAEAFVLTRRSIIFNEENKKMEQEENKNDDTDVNTPEPTPEIEPVTTPVPVVNVGSLGGKGSSSGGGGGGGSPINKNVSLPVVNQLNEADNKLIFTTVANASSYTITASYGEFSEFKEVAETAKGKKVKVDLTDIISRITDNVKLPELPVSISIKSNAKSGYISSDQKEVGTITKKFTFLDSPTVSAKLETLPDTKHLVISWNEIENAEDYSVSLTVDSADVTSSVLVNKDSRVIVVKDLTLVDTASEIKFEISAISNSSNVISSIPTVSVIDYNNLEAKVGTGSEEDPYIIRNLEDFELIRTNLDKHFLLATNITVSGNFEPFGNFSGSLKGYDEENDTAKKRIINLNINKPSSTNVGLFQELSGFAAIDSIVVDGSINGSGAVGSIAGTTKSGDISVTNCVNRAEINASANNAGGILGYVEATGTAVPVIDHCSNLGTIISTASNVGGIIGYPFIGATANVVSNCSNYGSIKGVGNIGGILGAAYGGVTKSFNAGCVESTNGSAGGIAGVTSKIQDPITYCYNVGTVKAFNIAGGISFGPANGSSSILIKYCYHVGQGLQGVNNYPISTTNSLSSLANNFYVLENNTNTLAGTISLTSEELNDRENANTQILLTGEDDKNKFIMVEGLMYPQIPGNLYGEKYLLLPLGAAQNADVTSNAVTWENSDENVVKYSVKIVDKNTYNIVASEEIDASGTGNEEFSFQFENGILYEITITAMSEDGNTSDSTVIFKTF